MAALVEKQLEEKTIALLHETLAGIGTQSIRIEGSWAFVPDGEVKGVETPGTAISIGVAVGAPKWTRYTVPDCEMPVAFSVAVRREKAPTGAALSAIAERIADMLIKLQLEHDEVSSRLTTENFNADGVMLDGGPAPTFAESKNIWRITRSFTVRGVVHKSSEV